MRKYLFSIVLLTLMFLPLGVFADETIDKGFSVVAQEEKYYKTVIPIINNLSKMDQNSKSYTVEVTKEEYESSNNIQTYDYSYVETTYKRMTSYILTNGSYYRYKVTLHWKNFPKVRSYDTIAIGHNASVKVRGSINFDQTYCDLNNSCKTINIYYPKITTTGSGATFKLPTGDLTALSQTIYFDVEKNVNDAKVISQKAVGDYSHAVKTVTSTQARKYNISIIGITLDSSIIDSFDEMSSTTTLWEGSW